MRPIAIIAAAFFLLPACSVKRVHLDAGRAGVLLEELSRNMQSIPAFESAATVRVQERGRLPVFLRGTIRYNPGGHSEWKLYDIWGRRVIPGPGSEGYLDQVTDLLRSDWPSYDFSSIEEKGNIYLFSDGDMRISVARKNMLLIEYISRSGPIKRIKTGNWKRIAGFFFPRFIRVWGEDYYMEAELSGIKRYD